MERSQTELVVEVQVRGCHNLNHEHPYKEIAVAVGIIYSV